MILKKSMIEAMVTGISAVVLVVLLVAKPGGKNKAARATTPKGTAPSPELLARIETLKAKATNVDPKVKEKQVERASLPWGRDPFFPGQGREVTPQGEKPSLRCKGISYVEGEAVALIDYTVVREGEYIEGYVVERIAEDRVVVRKGDRTYVLRVGEE
jgi:hypothetical protein